METLKTVREKLFLSQDELAVYLNISRSHLANIEKGNKTIPAQAIERLTQLHTATLQNNRHLVNIELVQQQNELAHFVQKNTNANIATAKKLQKKLTKMQDDYNAVMQTLQAIRNLKNNVLQGNAKDILWCKAVEATLLEALKKLSLVEQKKLELKIQAIEV